MCARGCVWVGERKCVQGMTHTAVGASRGRPYWASLHTLPCEATPDTTTHPRVCCCCCPAVALLFLTRAVARLVDITQQQQEQEGGDQEAAAAAAAAAAAGDAAQNNKAADFAAVAGAADSFEVCRVFAAMLQLVNNR